MFFAATIFAERIESMFNLNENNRIVMAPQPTDMRNHSIQASRLC